MNIGQFRTRIWNHYAGYGRHSLPWRKSHDPYKVLVSEIMLQQTQVERVIPYFTTWIKKYPNVKALAKAPLSDVLRQWQGLGYNRRAKMLHAAAKTIVKEFAGRMPRSVEDLEELPGVGPYTARAIAAFAYNQDTVFIETNIRTAVIHHFFADKGDVTDEGIEQALKKALPHGRAREWYSALMDYGAHLKRSGVRLNARSKGYAKQSVFEGSPRQTRGAILRTLSNGPARKATLLKLMPQERTVQMEEQLAKLLGEGMVELKERSYRLPS